ncbi:TonB-dependent receptor [Rheinheimera sp.]|uniref:TonB-dependent receptor n=1 Tax=Rheinheimera sp. TaxID=1869214 RepID=UPI00262665B3|nr:TonB-dependent receptor [Rheinheimera sp.]MCA1930175.1 TonB-dependent receptor [Rheinheimera sp.]
MLHNKMNKCAVAVKLGLMAGAAALAFPAMADQAADKTDAKKEQQVEVIQVTGIRASQEANLNAKRFSDTIIDVITAEDIGKFPDKNVAESLQRVPGVTIQRQFGEGAAVSIRGAGQDLTLTTLNGQNVASTGWFVLEPARRSFNYELLPSELVGDLEVYKSSQADLAEGGVGGTVVVNTRKPLDLDPLTVYGSIEGQYQTDSGETDPLFSGMTSWKNDDETFGVLVAGVVQNRSLQRQGNEAFWQWGAGPVAFEQERKRSAITATFQYAPNDALNIVFNAMDMKMEADNTNYALWLTQADTTWGGGTTEEWLGDPSKGEGTPVKGPLNVAYWQARPREATMNSDVFDVKVEYKGDNYVWSTQLGDTSSTGGTDFEMVVDDGTGGTPIPGGTYDFTKGYQSWNTNGFNITNYNPGSLTMGTGANFNRTPKEDGETYIQSDIKFDVELGAINAIKTGFRYADHNTTSRRFEYIQKAGFNPTISTADIGAGTIDVGAGDYSIQKFDPNALKAWAKASIIGENEDLGAYSEITEKNAAAYLMANYGVESIRGNFGVRYVTTDATSTYYLAGKKQDSDADYAEFLPSFNIVMDLADDVILRASAARTLARPQYVDMYVNPNVMGTNDDLPNNQRWIVGNIGLKPFIADQFDLGIEWYFDANSMVSAGLFSKDVKNFVNVVNSSASAEQIPFPLTRPEEAANGWIVQQKENGKDATIQGLELQYQQYFGNGFGSLVNYTYTDTETDPTTFSDLNGVLSDSSRHSYNLSGYYEDDLFQVRLSYNWRSEYMIREAGSYGNRLHDDYGSLDMSSVWHVTDHIDVKLDVVNILEEGSKQFGNNQGPSFYNGFADGFPIFEYEMARRISLGASFKF